AIRAGCAGSWSWLAASQGPGEGRVIDIAAGADDGHDAILYRQFAGESGCQRHRATRLDHDLEFTEGEFHGAEHLVVAHHEAWLKQLLRQRKGDVAWRRREQ